MRAVIDAAFNESNPKFLKGMLAREASNTCFESSFIRFHSFLTNI
jgi:hypothetical protein